MIPFAIVLATLTAGIGSVWLAAALSFGALARYTQHMLSLAAGALLSTAFMHLLPKAFESRVEAHDLFLALLAGLVFFFLLSKAELWHHGHEHHHRPEHSHQAHEHDSADPVSQTSASWVVLAGDRSGRANLNNFLSGNSGHKVLTMLVRQIGVSDGQEISTTHTSYPYTGVQGPRGPCRFA